ncbi:PAS domain-containing sensor histidine kinase [Fulvivirga ulvae]|uniref:sensor histidine kinase n=1 Tax=Fulvivirga ulvae TaxID=2904245 RepID=UPI001F3D4FA6|nr:PAS domain-containing sensor histidine kinase [Fulvivirga ulvae]UII32012.1 PAS domain-containing sensor histidine kinase [Fulvivirga ulvae]
MMQLISVNQKKTRNTHLCEDCSIVLGHSNEAFMWIDQNGRIDFANQVVARLSQYATNELKGMSLFELAQDISPSLWSKYWENVKLTGQMEIECNLISKDGGLAPVSVKLHKSAQNPSMASAIIKISQSSLDEHTRLKRVSYEYDRLLYRTSHDLRAPISTVLGLINLLKKDEAANQKEYLDLIEETMTRQQLLMKDINHLALIGSTEVKIEKIDFHVLLQDVLTTFEEDSAKRGIKWNFNFKLGSPFYSDYYLLTKILIPIVDNAIRYNNSKTPSVKVTVESVREKTIITLEDNGIGIEPEVSKSIFEMFFRGAETSKGSGLGLYLALITATKLKGNVVLSSSGESGSTFKVEIPNISYSEFAQTPF